MVSNCDCEKGHPVKIVVSVGLVALALFLAVCVVVFERVAPRIETQLGISPSVQQPAPGGISYDTLKNAPLNQLPVNEQASREVKKQQPPLGSPAKPQPQPGKIDVVSVPTNKRASILLFVGTDPKSSTLLDWFNRDQGCQQLKSNCNFQAYTKDNALYRERYSGVIPAEQFPAILFCDSDGGHIYVAANQSLPSSASSLLAEMKRAYEAQKQAREQDADPAQTIEGSPPNCPDGSCRPSDREPFINPDRAPLFPSLRPDRPPAESILYWLWNPGEAVLALGCAGMFAILVLLVVIKVIRS